jgi:hypothetical protein
MPNEISDLTPEQSARIDKAVVAINALVNREALALALGVGEVVIDEFFGGDLATWRAVGTKELTFRALAARSDLEMTPTRLYYSVGIFELSQELGGLEQFAPPLTYSHLRLVLGKPADEQRRLLTAAKSEGWTVARLAQEVDAATGKADRQPQLRAMTEVRRAFRQLGEILDDSEGLVADLGRAGIDPEATGPLAGALDQLRAQLQQLNEHLPAKARFTEVRK